MKEITVEELKQKIDNEDSFTLLDVRDAHELFISDIDSEKINIPYDDLKSRLGELSKESEIIAMCRSGNSSADACNLLVDNGFTRVASLKGGINEWASRIDPSLSIY
ncbi:MAG: rhodanese-like domain-containing protein [Balneolaceae bacterium]|nr:MAG: rhodanese-like domain-containing protein [Balneolaceae bacterium]